jgi:4-alpha-glucanotransferase
VSKARGRVVDTWISAGQTVHASAQTVAWAEKALGYDDWPPASGARTWGAAVQIYALRSAASQGVGDLVDLAFCARILRDRGASCLLVNPLCAWPLTDHRPWDPYSPGSRLLRDPVYLSVPTVARQWGFDQPAGPGYPDPGRWTQRWREVRTRKLGALRHLFRQWQCRRPEDDGFRSFVATLARSELVAAVLFQDEMAGVAAGSAASTWTEETSAALAERAEFCLWLQWQLDHQVRAVDDILPLWVDLPIGLASAGLDLHIWPHAFLREAFIGAPPDAFSDKGQNWRIIGWSPRVLQDGGVSIAETVRAMTRSASGLRIDHVLGFDRLFCIPQGGTPRDGVYVQQDVFRMLDIVKQEQQRRRLFVLCEDVGTPSEAVASARRAFELPGFRLALLDPDMDTFTPDTVGALTNHDTPTLWGLCTGSDLEQQERQGPPTDGDYQRYLRRWLVDNCGPLDDVAAISRTLHERLAASDSRSVLVHVEDVLGCAWRPHFPGAFAGPEWTGAHPVALEDWPALDTLNMVTSVMSETRP